MRSATIMGAVLQIIVATAQPIAQQPGVGLQVPFQETDISAPGHEAVTGVIDFAPEERRAGISTAVKWSDTWSRGLWCLNRMASRRGS